jgi:hypothetical protein
MKTVKEAAHEYAQKNVTLSVYAAFTEGVEFAQRWIPVEDELPDEKEAVFHLVKTDGGCAAGTYFNKKWYIDSWLINLKHTPVTHWRPIEFK